MYELFHAFNLFNNKAQCRYFPYYFWLKEVTAVGVLALALVLALVLVLVSVVGEVMEHEYRDGVQVSMWKD
jgi:hypothetical protein